MAKDYYEILGINRNATNEDIKNTYKKLAFEYHPDRNPDDQDSLNKFKDINEAYQILGDDNKRAQYDSFGSISGDGNFGDMGFSSNLNDIFGNLFEEVFNSGFSSNGQKGRDLKYELTISFEEAAFGMEKEIVVPKRELCDTCEGKGAAPGGDSVCGVCKGRGSVNYAKGFFAISQPCGQCRGRGYIIEKYCNECEGDGFIRIKKKVKINIPAGIADSSRLRIRDEGEIGMGGAPDGDLFIIIFVADHKIFKRDNNNIYCEVPIDFITATIGGEIKIPTLGGIENFNIPEETQPGQSFRIKGKGLPDLQTGRLGDLYLIINIDIPNNLSSKQKKVLKDTLEDIKPQQFSNLDSYNKTLENQYKK